MVSIKNVAVVGAAGALGSPVLKVIVDSGKFNVTVVSREGSKSTFPESVTVVHADYTSVDSLTAAFKDQDAVLSMVGTEGLLGQSVLVDAAIAAGVKRFLPSEFGSDLSNPLSGALPVFGYKVATRKYIEEKVAGGADITYTYVVNGGFLDWGLNVGFLLDLSKGKPSLYNGGDVEFSATLLSNVGKGVVGVLEHYEETKNRTVYIHDRVITQNRLIEIAKKVAPEKEIEGVVVKTEDIKKSSDESLAKGEITVPVMIGYLFSAIFDPPYGGKYEKTDNELLGVPAGTDEEIEEIFKKILV